MTLGRQQLLGFAFAGADLLIEVSRSGQIQCAIGASEALSGSPEDELLGRPWPAFLDPRDAPVMQALFDGIEVGQRGGPAVVRLRERPDGGQRAAAVSAFKLPGNGEAISCSLIRTAFPRTGGRPNGLHDRQSFEQVASTVFEMAQITGQDLELALIQMSGLDAARQRVGLEGARALDARLGGALRSQAQGGAAAELGEDRYALIRERGESPTALAERIIRMIGIDAAEGVGAAASSLAVDEALPSGQLVKALRYSLDGFIRGGIGARLPANLGEAVAMSVQKTLTDIGELGSLVAEKRFRLAFQPVVDLQARPARLHHYEVLVRFGDAASPFPMIRMAEELDLIEPLDRAVTERSVQLMSQDPSLSLAVNVSGRTITSPGFVDFVSALLVANESVRGRLMFELTESAAIDDLTLADRHLQALRREGCRICLDDFGAGAASLAYLQQLSLDVVKIDGAYIRYLQHGGRDGAFIRHLVAMCAELGVKTLAEMVETAEVEAIVRSAGIDYAQGWLYGAAAETPLKPKPPPGRSAVRPALRRG